MTTADSTPASTPATTPALTSASAWAVAWDYRILVYRRAKRFAGRGIERDDLIQEGFIGLFRAIQRFDAGRGFPLQTYAVLWIDSMMRQAIKDRHRPLRIPTGAMKLARKVERGVRGFDTLSAIERRTVAAVEAIRGSSGDGGSTPLRTIPDRHGPGSDPTEDATRGDLIQVVVSNLGLLTPREREVVEARYGLGVGDDRRHEKVFAEIGASLGITKEGARRVHMRAIEKLIDASGAGPAS